MKIYLNCLESSLSAKTIEFFFLKIINADSVILSIEVVFEFAISLAGKVELSKIISSIISKK